MGTHTHAQKTREILSRRKLNGVMFDWSLPFEPRAKAALHELQNGILYNNFHPVNFKTLLYNNTGLSKPTLPLVRVKRNTSIKADEWEKSLNHLFVIFCCPFFFILNSVQRLFKWPGRSSVYFYERNNPRSAKANFHSILNS
jgi:hypothetical protein